MMIISVEMLTTQHQDVLLPKSRKSHSSSCNSTHHISYMTPQPSVEVANLHFIHLGHEPLEYTEFTYGEGL